MSEYYGSASEYCETLSLDAGLWMFGNAIASISLIISLTCCQHGLHCGDVSRRSRPRLVYPVNFLRNYDHRLAYLFSFIAMSGSVLQLFIYGAPKPGGIVDPSLRAFVSQILKYIAVCLVGLIFYPFPLSVSFDTTPMNVFGLLYTTNWLVFAVYAYIRCPFGTIEGDIQGAVNIPIVLSLIGLEVYFIRRTVRMCRRFMNAETTERRFEDTHYYVRVRHLLLPAATWASRNKPDGTAAKIFRRFYPSIPGFKYSTRIVCTVGLAIACMYQACAYYIMGWQNILTDWSDYSQEINFKGTFYASSIMSFVITVINSTCTLRNYRNDTRSLWIGDYSLSFNQQRSHSVVLSAMKFTGYTIAFLISGFIILQLVLWGIFAGLELIFVNDLVRPLIRENWMHFFMIALIYIALRVFARFALLQANEDGALVLKNMHLLHIITFFFIFLSVLLGLAGCIFRIFKAAVVGILVVGRVDRCLFIRGYERFDRGYMAYRGYLKLEVSMTHPVLVTFCHLLSCQSSTEKKYRPGDHAVVNEMGDAAAISTTYRNRIARNRWLVAYTLIRNPQLIYKKPLRVEKQNPSAISLSEIKTSHIA